MIRVPDELPFSGLFEPAPPPKTDSPLRIGVLGTSAVAPFALIKPARRNPRVVVAAVASRDAGRAAAYAARMRIPKVHSRYEDLIADPDVDAIYNPLPNNLHCEWTIKALNAGKHVLCEKPLASNADEAQKMREAADKNKRVLAEAFHYRYHPMVQRLKELADDGEIGAMRRIEVKMCAFLLGGAKKTRFTYGLAGGCAMDVGCYTINLLRYLTGAEPKVESASARLVADEIDGAMNADFLFPDGRTASMTCSLIDPIWKFRLTARIEGDKGEIKAINPFTPHLFNSIQIESAYGIRSESVARGESTYAHQLQAFVDAVEKGIPMPTDGADGALNMRVVDAVYEKAGLRRRGL